MLHSTFARIQESQPGSIVLIKLVQADGCHKRRPAIILKQMPGYGDFLVCGISSRLRQTIPEFDEVLLSSPINGLKVTSVVRLSFLDVIPQKQVIKVIGQVSDATCQDLLQRLTDYLQTD